MRILAFSDIHASTSAIRDIATRLDGIDLLVGAGDYCNMRRGLSPVIHAIAELHTPAILVHGNAESAQELSAACAPFDHLTPLHADAVTINDHTFFGLGAAVPETPFGEWSVDLSEDEAASILEACPHGAVLISHSPPRGLCDRSSSGQSIGSAAVRACIDACQPAHVLCGHIHASWGATATVGATTIMNLGPAGVVIDLP